MAPKLRAAAARLQGADTLLLVCLPPRRVGISAGRPVCGGKLTHAGPRGRSALRLRAEQREQAAMRVGEVSHHHAVLQLVRCDNDLAAEFFGPRGGRGDVGHLDDEDGVRRDGAAGIEDAAGGTGGAGGGDQRVGAVGGERPAEERAVEGLGGARRPGSRSRTRRRCCWRERTWVPPSGGQRVVTEPCRTPATAPCRCFQPTFSPRARPGGRGRPGYPRRGRRRSAGARARRCPPRPGSGPGGRPARRPAGGTRRSGTSGPASPANATGSTSRMVMTSRRSR